MGKIRFSDLSWSLKTGIILAWVIGIIYGIIILVSFISELLVI